MRRIQIMTALLALAGLLPAYAQYTFTLNVSWSGNCSGYTAQMNQMMGKYKSQAITGFPTRELCEQTRAMCHQELGHIEIIYYDVKTGKEIKREATNCKLNVSTTPCTGHPMAGSVGTLNALGVSQGSSFYSSNIANEIQNWSEDDMERMLALNSEFKSYEPTKIATGDIDFDNNRSGLASGATFVSLDMRPGGSSTIISEDLLPLKERQANVLLVSDYLDRLQGMTIPDLATGEQYNEWIRDTFKEVSGYDIAAISKKYDLSEEEKQVLANYREFFSEMSDRIVEGLKRTNDTKVFEMSVLSDDSYGGSDFLGMTNYERMNIDNLPLNSPMKETLTLINMFDGAAGFHPELYYNKSLGEYTIAFEGSNNPLKLPSFIEDWCMTNFKQGVGGVPTQFKMAAFIAAHIPEGVKVNFTGHSLGGGLASLCGAITGKPTYTFNAEGVNDNILHACKVSTEDMNRFTNIKAYHTDNDILSNTQDMTGKRIAVPAIGERINIGNLQGRMERSIYGAANTALPGIGNLASKGMAHRLKPMVNYFYVEKERKQNDITLALANERSRSAMRTVESVPIRME